MKKRLRKKLFLKKFQQLGFRFSFDFVGSTSEAQEWEFVLDLMAYEDDNAVSAAGGRNTFYVYPAPKRGSVTLSQRHNLINWLKQRTDITNVEVKPLTDAWYPAKRRGCVPKNPGDVSEFFSLSSRHA
jgi:uncharacterized protein YggL (DUF469 family)